MSIVLNSYDYSSLFQNRGTRIWRLSICIPHIQYLDTFYWRGILLFQHYTCKPSLLDLFISICKNLIVFYKIPFKAQGWLPMLVLIFHRQIVLSNLNSIFSVLFHSVQSLCGSRVYQLRVTSCYNDYANRTVCIR